jgi:hypothetical protein
LLNWRVGKESKLVSQRRANTNMKSLPTIGFSQSTFTENWRAPKKR